jgi:hypothetical protein
LTIARLITNETVQVAAVMPRTNPTVGTTIRLLRFHFITYRQGIGCLFKSFSREVTRVRGSKSPFDTQASRITITAMTNQSIQGQLLGYRFSGALGRAKGLVRQSAVLALSLVVLGGGRVCLAQQEAEAQKILALANAKEAEAQKLRNDAGIKQQEAANDEASASALERTARIFTARAMQMMKADANRQRSFHLRNQAKEMWLDARNKLIAARNAEQKALQARHDSEELMKAAAQVKDQAGVADSLQNDAKAQASQAQALEQSANTDKAAAEVLDKRAETAWAEAEKLDPATHRALAPKPAKPELRPAVSH